MAASRRGPCRRDLRAGKVEFAREPERIQVEIVAYAARSMAKKLRRKGGVDA